MRKRILVVDKSDTIISVCRNMLTRQGYEAVLFNKGSEALAEWKKSDFDLAVIATETEDVSGYFIIGEVRKHAEKGKMPVLMLIGSSELMDAGLLLDASADDTLNKPFSPQELIHKIEMLLKRSSVTQEEQEEDIDLESILTDESESLDQKVSAVTDSILSGTLDTAGEQEGSAAPQIDKLEIAEDQFELSKEESGSATADSGPHDYAWFVKEMSGDDGAAPIVEPEKPSLTEANPSSFEIREMGTSRISLEELQKMRQQDENLKTKDYLAKLGEPLEKAKSSLSVAPNSVPGQGHPGELFIRELAQALAKEIASRIDVDEIVRRLEAGPSAGDKK